MYKTIIIDDEIKIRNGISNIFPWSTTGFHIVGEFSNGQSALNYINENPVDLILSDIRMPVMDGIELSSALSDLSTEALLVFFSGYQDFQYAQSALRNGVFDYLVKPLKYEDLLLCLERAKEYLDKKYGNIPKEEPKCYYDKIIETVLKYIETNYQNASLEKAGRLVNLSPNYLSKLIKEHYKTSFSDYLFETRMKKATLLLDNITYKQYEIAYLVGYDNPKNFSRAFKQYYNITPREYREQKH